VDYRIGVGALDTTGSPPEDLHNRAVLGLACGYGMISGQSFRAKQRNVLAGELKEIGLFAWLRFVGHDDESSAGR
jgi:hypothetical protein